MSLANFDISLLEAWYDDVEGGHLNLSDIQSLKIYTASNTESTPKLVVVLHNFEQFDPNVVQDMLYICRFVHSLTFSAILT
jgi:origin recognition complex subunit 3